MKMHHQIHQSLQETPLVSSPLTSGDEPIILALASQDYPLIVTVPASLTMDQDITDENPYSRASPIVQATGDVEQLICLRPTTPYLQASPIEQAIGDMEQLTCLRLYNSKFSS